MTAPESHDTTVVEEQRVIQQAMDTLLDIHREHDEDGYPPRHRRGFPVPARHPQPPRPRRAPTVE